MDEYLIKKETLTNLGNKIRSLTNTTGDLSPDEMLVSLDNVSQGEDLSAEMATQDDLIAQIIAALETKLAEGNVSLITFTIDGVECQAEEGMTWTEWIESDYNTNEWYVDGTIIRKNSTYALAYMGTIINAEQTIDPDAVEDYYGWTTWGEPEPT